MKKFIALSIAFLLALSVSAQQFCRSTITPKNENVLADCWHSVSATSIPPAQVDLKLNPQMTTGRNLLIAGGCCLGVGAALFPMAYLCISDAPAAYALGGVCSIGGVTLMCASVPLFISGSIIYIKGKKNNTSLSFTGSGLTLHF